jgi:hypothetical protein
MSTSQNPIKQSILYPLPQQQTRTLSCRVDVYQTVTICDRCSKARETETDIPCGGATHKIDSAQKTPLSDRSSFHLFFLFLHLSLGLPVLSHSQYLEACVTNVHRVMLRIKACKWPCILIQLCNIPTSCMATLLAFR